MPLCGSVREVIPKSVVSNDEPSTSNTADPASPSKRPRVVSHSELQQKAFIIYIAKAGLQLKSDGPYILEHDKTRFNKELTSALRANASFPANVDHMIWGFAEFLRCKNLERALEPTKRLQRGILMFPPQESLVRLMLSVKCIQPALWQELFDIMAQLIREEETNEKSEDLIAKILREMKSLNMIYAGGADQCTNFLELVHLSTNLHTQIELILAIPYCIREEDRETAVLKISENTMQQHTLIPAYLESLASMLFSCDSCHQQVIDNVIDALLLSDGKYFQRLTKEYNKWSLSMNMEKTQYLVSRSPYDLIVYKCEFKITIIIFKLGGNL